MFRRADSHPVAHLLRFRSRAVTMTGQAGMVVCVTSPDTLDSPASTDWRRALWIAAIGALLTGAFGLVYPRSRCSLPLAPRAAA